MTKELDQVLRESFTIDFISAVLSNPRERGGAPESKDPSAF